MFSRISLFDLPVKYLDALSWAGYWIGGFGLGESMDERPALLNAVTVSYKLVFISRLDQ